MKITLTGSLGHIGKPLAQALIAQQHQLTIITSSANRAKDIEALGAIAAIGSLEDEAFVAQAFAGAHAVYTMVPPNNYFDHNLDLHAYYRRLGANYKMAIAQAGVKHVVNLSSIGAHRSTGIGILVGAHDVEQKLNELPEQVSITHLRPVSFYYNLLGYMHSIKQNGFIAANYGETELIPWVSPLDIADAAAEELTHGGTERKVRYVVSDEATGPETAAILGKALGMNDLRWVQTTDEEVRKSLVQVGINPGIATGLAELYSGFRTGILSQDYHLHKPSIFGKVKLAQYALNFAEAYHQ